MRSRGMSLVAETIASIRPLNNEAAWAADERLDSLTKPAGSLGYLEEIVRRYAAIRHDGSARMGSGAIAVFVADHGVASEGVSAFPQSVTAEMLRNIASGGAAISVLARRFGYELKVIDVGVKIDTSATPLEGVIYRRVGAGITLIAPSAMVGRGTGLDDAGIRRKTEVIVGALHRHRGALDDGASMLAALGGFEIAAMAGVCLAGAALNVPVVVDGFIATAAAAVAERIRPGLFEHLFFSHRSAEGGHARALEHFKVRPILDLDLRLGEGTGAALAMQVIESALDLFHNMATFASAGVTSKL